jgi:pSer/pThr/pTyr-binding forkhead associated (FHA) protein
VAQPADDGGDLDATVVAPRRAAWVIVDASGDRHDIRSATVIGRSPVAPLHVPRAVPLALDDPTKSLSKSHAVLEPLGDELVVEDLGSTNGTIIVEGGGVETELGGGQKVGVRPGVRLELGEFVLTVSRG